MWLGNDIDLRALQSFGCAGELGSMNSNGWCRRPANTNMRYPMGKGSTEVVDAINGFGAVWKDKRLAACWVRGISFIAFHLRPEGPLK